MQLPLKSIDKDLIYNKGIGGVIMNTEIVNPVIGNFVKSLRDIGYTFEVAVADILDNSITAQASEVDIFCIPSEDFSFSILDNGKGMEEKELINAMRLATNDPDLIRDPNDLGKFGLGLKTASFSQAKKVTVITKSEFGIHTRQWDLDFISKKNQWLLITPDLALYEEFYLYKKLKILPSGTVVIWENIDSFEQDDIANKLEDLRNHLSLVFHMFVEKKLPGYKKLKISVNGNVLEAFNPFNPEHMATQDLRAEIIIFKDEEIIVQPYILPHHSKLTQAEFDRYATAEGYTKSQGFYLYRGNRLLIHGTWWGMHKMTDAHKLVRIKIEINNAQDHDWGIDIKKSTARPVKELKRDLQRIIQNVTVKGSRVYTGRGMKVQNRVTTNFWDLVSQREGHMKFTINREHPFLYKLLEILDEDQEELLDIYLKSLEGYLPLDSIIAQVHTNPHKIVQESEISDEHLYKLIQQWKDSGVSDEFIKSLLKTELFKGKGDLVLNEK